MTGMPPSYDDDISRGADPGIAELSAGQLEILFCLTSGTRTIADVMEHLGNSNGGRVTAMMTDLYHHDFVTRGNPDGWQTPYTITAEGLAELNVMTEVSEPDHPGNRAWSWRVEGRSTSHGSSPRYVDEHGLIKAEGAGEALAWLVSHGPMWEGLDTDHEFKVTVTPAGEAQ